MSNKPERVSAICHNNDRLKQITQRVRKLNQLNLILQNALPLQFANHCRLANVSNDKIIIHTDNAGYASLLRFQAPSLCKTFSTHLEQPVHKLEVKVRPLTGTQQATTQPQTGLSAATASLIKNTAEALETGPLKQALQKLAKRQQTENKSD